MPDVRTNALMPSGETNGLAAIATELVKEARGETPDRLRAVIALIDARRAYVDKDSGEWTVTVRFRRVEVLLPGDLPEAEKLLRRALEKRSGSTVLPMELEDDLESAFAGLDLSQPDPDEAGEPADPDAVVDVEIVDDDPDGDSGDDLDDRDDGEWDDQP